jgi:hypothetical protein
LRHLPLAPEAKPEAASDNRLSVAYQELIGRLSDDITPEQRAILTRRQLAKIVGSAVEAYLARHTINLDPIMCRELVTNLIQTLLASQGEGLAPTQHHQKAVEVAKAKILPLVLEHMDAVAGAAAGFRGATHRVG